VKLIENIEQVHRLWSVRLAAVGAALSAAWAGMSEAHQAAVIDALGLPPSALAAIGFLAVIFGRVVSQPSVKKGGGTGGDEPGP
jgi:hypothetical protein